MPVTSDQPAPYAPASAILGLIERHRNKGLPTPVNADVLERAGVSGSLIARTLYALQSLDLIEESGKPSPILEGLRLTPQAEYQQRMAEWLNGAYADALQFIDPAADDETKIRDAFRSYNPVGQQSRMVTLFVGLYAASAIRQEKQKSPSRRSSSAAPTAKAARPAAKPLKYPPAPPLQNQNREPLLSTNGSLPPALAGLLASLPAYGQSWPKAKRDHFVNTFGAVLDFCFPIETARKAKSQHEEEVNEADLE